MGALWCYSLQFPHGYHVSSGGFQENRTEAKIASDTLSGALLSAYALLFGDAALEELLQQSTLPFRLSSTVPLIGSIRCLPLPAALRYQLLHFYNADNALPLKQRKQIRFIAEPLLAQMLQNPGDPLTKVLSSADVLGNCLFPRETAAKLRTAFQRLPQHSKQSEDHFPIVLQHMAERPRVTIDRITAGSNVFYFTEVHHARSRKVDTGLFFWATFDTEEAQQRFDAALALLADEGIGADRTVGKGWFQWQKEPYKGPLLIAAEKPHTVWCNLGLYIPTAEELRRLKPSASYYTLTLRRGWIWCARYRNQRRRPMRAFLEGATLSFSEPIVPSGQIAPALDPANSPVIRNFQSLVLQLPEEWANAES